jgi:hypothetical protein
VDDAEAVFDAAAQLRERMLERERAARLEFAYGVVVARLPQIHAAEMEMRIGDHRGVAVAERRRIRGRGLEKLADELRGLSRVDGVTTSHQPVGSNGPRIK